MRVVIGADHAGFELKEFIIEHLAQAGHEVLDVGTHSTEPVDFPDYARAVAETVAAGKAPRGIVVCGSGVGATVAANKVPGARACMCHDTFSARQGVEDDDVNILCLGGRVIGSELAYEVVGAWLNAKFSGLDRHQRRKDKVLAIERAYSKEPAK